MTQKAAQILAEYGGEIRDGYSGRGMYGKETTGIIFNTEKDFYTVLASIIDGELDDEEREEVSSALRKLKTDNMGTEIIYY